jgi:hypothetical protein
MDAIGGSKLKRLCVQSNVAKCSTCCPVNKHRDNVVVEHLFHVLVSRVLGPKQQDATDFETLGEISSSMRARAMAGVFFQ